MTEPRATPSGEAAERIARHTAVLAAVSILTSLLLLVWQVMLARELGVERYGIYGTIGALLAIAAAIPDLGMGSIMIRDIVRMPAKADRYLRASLCLHVLLALAAWPIVLTAGWLIGFEIGVRRLLAFAALSLLIDAIGTVAYERLIAAERMTQAALIGSVHVILLVAAGAAALGAGGGLWGVYLAITGTGVVRALLYWRVIRRAGWWPPARVDRTIARQLVVHGGPLGLAAFLSLAFLHADKLIVTALEGPAATGQLLAAFVIAFGITQLLGSNVQVAAMPVLARASRTRMPVMVEHLLIVMMFAAVPTAIVLATTAEPIVQLLFGEGYDQTAATLQVMGAYVVIRLVGGLMVQMLTLLEEHVHVLVGRAGGLIVNLIVTVLLLPAIGITGAAIGMVVGEVVVVAAALRVIAPTAAWWARQVVGIARLVPAAAAMAWCAVWIGPRTDPIVGIAVGVITYGGLAMVTGAVTRHHLQLILHVGTRALSVVRAGFRASE